MYKQRFLDFSWLAKTNERKKERKEEKAHHAHEGEEESTVTSKSLAARVALLSSPRPGSGPLFPQLIKVLQKTGPWLQLNRDTEHGVPQVRSRLEGKREEREEENKVVVMPI